MTKDAKATEATDTSWPFHIIVALCAAPPINLDCPIFASMSSATAMIRLGPPWWWSYKRISLPSLPSHCFSLLLRLLVVARRLLMLYRSASVAALSKISWNGSKHQYSLNTFLLCRSEVWNMLPISILMFPMTQILTSYKLALECFIVVSFLTIIYVS
jgi:hypothetical protein